MRYFHRYLVPFLMIFLISFNSIGEEVLFKVDLNPKKQVLPVKSKTPTNKKKRVPSNLPKYLSKNRGPRKTYDGGEIIVASKSSHKLPNWIKPGAIFKGKILHSVLAFPDEKTPVVAKFSNKNIRLLGEAHLEANSKRILIHFKRIVIGAVTYSVSSIALTDFGTPGFLGKYYSKEFSIFSADFLSRFTAAYFEGLRPRATNLLGQDIETGSVDSAVKKGLAEGALSSAERFREKLKKVPEFSELLGPRPIKILIQ